MHLNTQTILNAVTKADTFGNETEGTAAAAISRMLDAGISPTIFAQTIADHVVTECATSAPEQKPSTPPAIGDTIAIRDVQPGMTVKIGDWRKRFHGKVETVLTVGHQTEINGIEFNSTSAATITRQWAQPITIINAH